MTSEIRQTHPHDAFVGKVVSWAGPDGETLTGVVQQFNPEIGKLIVRTDEGMKAVAPSRLDQYEA